MHLTPHSKAWKITQKGLTFKYLKQASYENDKSFGNRLLRNVPHLRMPGSDDACIIRCPGLPGGVLHLLITPGLFNSAICKFCPSF